MDFLFEILFSIVFEGIIETAECKKVPMLIRIIAGVLVIGVFLAAIGVVILVGCLSFKDNKFLGIFMFLIALLFLVSLIIKIVKFKNKH